jgi:hypothetical protein
MESSGFPLEPQPRLRQPALAAADVAEQEEAVEREVEVEVEVERLEHLKRLEQPERLPQRQPLRYWTDSNPPVPRLH